MAGTFNNFVLVDGYQLGSSDGYFTSPFIDVSDKSLVSFSVVFTGGSASGTVKLQQSNDLQFTGGNSVYPLHVGSPASINDTNDCVAVSGTGQVVSQSVSGSKSYPLELKNFGAKWVRLWFFGNGGASTALDLGRAAGFGALAASTLTSTGATIVNGDLGLYSGTSVTGFPPGTVTGTQHITDTAAHNAQTDALSAYTTGQALAGGTTIVAGTYANGAVITPGVYKATSSLNFTGGIVTLDAGGNPDATFAFQIATTLVTASATQIVLANGASANNVTFLVGTSATLGTTTVFSGSIIANTAITDNGGSTVNGRLMALTAAVTLNDTIVTVPMAVPVGSSQMDVFVCAKRA